MSTCQRIGLSFVCLFLLTALPACQSPRDPGSQGPTASGEENASASPMNERDRERMAAWAEALQGLSFDSGVLQLKEPPAQSDLAAAAQLIKQGDAEREINHRIPAVKAYANAVRVAPDMPNAYLGLGRALVAAGKLDEALATFRALVRLDPRNAQGRTEFAMALSMRKQMSEAVAEMNRVLEIDPSNAFAHERLAIWAYYQGDYSAAWEYVRGARKLGHDMPPQFMELLAKQMPDPSAS